jgi:LPS-assembly lipoprotein
MWWPDFLPRSVARTALVLAVAGLAGGCFQPIYGDKSPFGSQASVAPSLRSVDVAVVNAPNGTRLSRVGGEIRNDLLFHLTGGGGTAAPTHRLAISLTSQQLQIIVDINSGRPDTQNYGINATYSLTDLATGKAVVNGFTHSRVSFNVPGLQQRFAGARGLRDAEDRAAKVIAEKIRNHLVSYFTAGT